MIERLPEGCVSEAQESPFPDRLDRNMGHSVGI